jgi:Ulp1 family protease
MVIFLNHWIFFTQKRRRCLSISYTLLYRIEHPIRNSESKSVCFFIQDLFSKKTVSSFSFSIPDANRNPVQVSSSSESFLNVSLFLFLVRRILQKF